MNPFSGFNYGLDLHEPAFRYIHIVYLGVELTDHSGIGGGHLLQVQHIRGHESLTRGLAPEVGAGKDSSRVAAEAELRSINSF